MASPKRKKAAKPLSPRKIRKLAKEALATGRWIAKRRRKKLEPKQAEELEAANEALAKALKGESLDDIRNQGEKLAELLQGKLKPLRPSEIWMNVKWMLIFAGIALLLRLVVFELFSIPSGSMLPTLQVGDRVVVSKFSYGLRVPLTYTPPKKVWRGRGARYGEVIVFMHPEIPERDMVKRAIALGGDTIRFRDGRVWLKKKGETAFVPIPRTDKGTHRYCDYDQATDRWSNNTATAYEERHGEATYITLGKSRPPPSGPPYQGFGQALTNTRKRAKGTVEATTDTFGPIPEEHAFMLGDNREYSEDSRFWGTVPYDYLKGPALFDLFSYGGQVKDGCDTGVRWNRFFRPID